MLISKHRSVRRRGVAAVEAALVIPILLFFFFTVFQYGMLLMAWNALNNAAVIGCRYALVNNTSTTISTDVTTQVTNAMAGLNTSAFSSFTVTVSGTHGGVSTSVNNLVAGDLITVTVSGTYNLMKISPFFNIAPFAITSAPTMVCEGVN
jgi:Flp pilus assembly protein TadG